MCEHIEKTITELNVKISLDTNPLHLDEDYAKNTIFKGKIVRGIIRAEVQVIDLDKEKRKVELKTICKNQKGIIVIDGEAKVKL